MFKKTNLYTNKGCEGCSKNCKFKGLTVAEKFDTPKYGCNK
jgi:hypothetical protein